MQLHSKLKVARAEMADYKEEQWRVREELVVTVEELQKELKLRFVSILYPGYSLVSLIPRPTILDCAKVRFGGFLDCAKSAVLNSGKPIRLLAT